MPSYYWPIWAWPLLSLLSADAVHPFAFGFLRVLAKSMMSRLVEHRLADDGLQFFFAGAGTERRFQIHSIVMSQAQLERTVGSQPQAVALLAEAMAERIDKANFALKSFYGIIMSGTIAYFAVVFA